MKRLPRDKIDSLVLTRIKSNVSEGQLFEDIQDMRSLRALGIIYNHRRAESNQSIPRTPLLRLANLSKLESVELRGEMEGDFEESSNPDFEQCRRLQCVVFSGKLDRTAVASLSMLPTLRKLSCSFSGPNLLGSLQSTSLRSLHVKHIDEDGELIIPQLAKCKLPSLDCLQLPQSFPGGDSNFWKRFKAMEIPDAEMKCFKMFDEIRVSHPIKARWGIAAPGQSSSGSRVRLKTLGENLRIAEGRATPSSWGTGPSSLQYNCYEIYKAGQMSLQEFKDFIAFTFPYTSIWPEPSHEKLFTERELSEIKENWRNLRF